MLLAPRSEVFERSSAAVLTQRLTLIEAAAVVAVVAEAVVVSLAATTEAEVRHSSGAERSCTVSPSISEDCIDWRWSAEGARIPLLRSEARTRSGKTRNRVINFVASLLSPFWKLL